jgi:hypothetical protein
VPLLVLAAGLLLLIALFLVTLPLTLVQRYRAGTSRRRARGWVLTLNLVSMLISVGFFLVAVAITSLWVPRALPYGALGLLGGVVLGLLGLAASRWEAVAGELHYTPNRWLVLTLTLVVAARVAYGLWRGWHAWGASAGDTAWLETIGAAESMAAGALVIGYYLAYTAGLWRRLRRERRQVVRPRRLPRRDRLW